MFDVRSMSWSGEAHMQGDQSIGEHGVGLHMLGRVQRDLHSQELATEEEAVEC